MFFWISRTSTISTRSIGCLPKSLSLYLWPYLTKCFRILLWAVCGLGVRLPQPADPVTNAIITKESSIFFTWNLYQHPGWYYHLKFVVRLIWPLKRPCF